MEQECRKMDSVQDNMGSVPLHVNSIGSIGSNWRGPGIRIQDSRLRTQDSAPSQGIISLGALQHVEKYQQFRENHEILPEKNP